MWEVLAVFIFKVEEFTCSTNLLLFPLCTNALDHSFYKWEWPHLKEWNTVTHDSVQVSLTKVGLNAVYGLAAPPYIHGSYLFLDFDQINPGHRFWKFKSSSPRTLSHDFRMIRVALWLILSAWSLESRRILRTLLFDFRRLVHPVLDDDQQVGGSFLLDNWSLTRPNFQKTSTARLGFVTPGHLLNRTLIV